MDVPIVAKVAMLAVTPALLGAVVLNAPRWCAALAKLLPEPVDEERPAGPPIERLAADLRRLLRLHDELTASAHLAILAHRLWAVEAAIETRAMEAARALDVPYRDVPPGHLDRTELAALLRALAGAGLVLPATVGGFTRDGRL